jgi:5-hydroxyisourate hydrolase
MSTHVLDTSIGKPAAGVKLQAAVHWGGNWKELGHGTTDADGRCKALVPEGPTPEGLYRIVFETRGYFDARGVETFYPKVEIHFEIKDATAHYHVPLLVSPWGYSTYRGS